MRSLYTIPVWTFGHFFPIAIAIWTFLNHPQVSLIDDATAPFYRLLLADAPATLFIGNSISISMGHYPWSTFLYLPLQLLLSSSPLDAGTRGGYFCPSCSPLLLPLVSSTLHHCSTAESSLLLWLTGIFDFDREQPYLSCWINPLSFHGPGICTLNLSHWIHLMSPHGPGICSLNSPSYYSQPFVDSSGALSFSSIGSLPPNLDDCNPLETPWHLASTTPASLLILQCPQSFHSWLVGFAVFSGSCFSPPSQANEGGKFTCHNMVCAGDPYLGQDATPSFIWEPGKIPNYPHHQPSSPLMNPVDWCLLDVPSSPPLNLPPSCYTFFSSVEVIRILSPLVSSLLFTEAFITSLLESTLSLLDSGRMLVCKLLYELQALLDWADSPSLGSNSPSSGSILP